MQTIVTNQSATANWTGEIKRAEDNFFVQVAWQSVSGASGVFYLDSSLDGTTWTIIGSSAIVNGSNASDALLFDVSLRTDVAVRLRYVANTTSAGTFTVKARS